ncbi:hypothetical protein Esti_002221 [Eimeria stiedai]
MSAPELVAAAAGANSTRITPAQNGASSARADRSENFILAPTSAAGTRWGLPVVFFGSAFHLSETCIFMIVACSLKRFMVGSLRDSVGSPENSTSMQDSPTSSVCDPVASVAPSGVSGEDSSLLCAHRKEDLNGSLLVMRFKEPFVSFNLRVLSLGMATKVAIGTAALLQSEGCVTIEKVETAYFASARRKLVPKITILCKKTKDFQAIMEKEKERAASTAETAEPTPQQEPVKA